VKDWEGSGGGAEGRESKRERDRTQRENFTVIVWEGSGGGTESKERARGPASICGEMGLRLVPVYYFVVLLVTVCYYTNKQIFVAFRPDI